MRKFREEREGTKVLPLEKILWTFLMYFLTGLRKELKCIAIDAGRILHDSQISTMALGDTYKLCDLG